MRIQLFLLIRTARSRRRKGRHISRGRLTATEDLDDGGLLVTVLVRPQASNSLASQVNISAESQKTLQPLQNSIVLTIFVGFLLGLPPGARNFVQRAW